MNLAQYRGTPYAISTTASTSAIASFPQVGVAVGTATTVYITDIAGSSDKVGATVLVKSSDVVIWQMVIGTLNAAHQFNQSFITPLRCTVGTTASVTVDGTTACYANIAGFTLP